MFYQGFDLFTIAISLILAIKNLRRIRESTIYIIYFFFFFIYIVPLIMDYTLGFPEYFFHWDAIYNSYDKYAGFIESYKDETTRIIYDLFVIVIQFLLIPNKAKLIQKVECKEENNTVSSRLFIILFFFSILPIVFSLVVGYYYIPFIYGWRENPILSMLQNDNYYSTIEKFTYIGIASSLICLLSPNKNFLFKLLMLCICYMNVSIESKRSIVFFTMAIFLLLKYKGFGKKINIFQLSFITILCVVGIVIYSLYIKTNIRGYSDADQLYTNIRIDLFRDDTARLVIYSLFSNMKSVVEWPFQSYITEIMYLFPLDIINGMLRLEITSIGFNTYLTSTLVGASLSEGLRWMTTSMIDEALANFSIVSFILIPLFLKRCSIYIDNSKPFVQVLLMSSLLLSFMYSFNYIVYFLQFVFLIIYIQKKYKI